MEEEIWCNQDVLWKGNSEIEVAIQRAHYHIVQQLSLFEDEPIAVCVLLEGSLKFFSTLTTMLPCNFEICFIHVRQRFEKNKQIIKHISAPLSMFKNKKTLLLTDVVNTGETLQHVAKRIEKEGMPKQMLTISLICKSENSDFQPNISIFKYDKPEHIYGYGLKKKDGLYGSNSSLYILNSNNKS